MGNMALDFWLVWIMSRRLIALNLLCILCFNWLSGLAPAFAQSAEGERVLIAQASSTPVLNTATPSQLSVNQTTRITLTGSNLQAVNKVLFTCGVSTGCTTPGTTTADLVGRVLYVNANSVVVEIVVNPNSIAGQRTVKVSSLPTTNTGARLVSNAISFQVTPPPPTSSTTTLSGKVMSGDAIPKPLAGVRVYLEQFPGTGEAYTDANGNFKMTNLPARQTTVAVDGQVISNAQVQYPMVVVPANIVAGQANKLPYTVYVTAYDPRGTYTIPSTISTDMVLGNSNAPGLAVTLPAGLKITRFDGTPVTQLTISTVTPDRTPMPYPNGVAPRQLLSIQPADAILSQPVPVTFPNLYKGARPGDQVPLYRADHDSESGQFIQYGTGTVSQDGRLIVPNIDPATGKPYGLPAFSWHFPYIGGKSPEIAPKKNDCPCAQSVDASSGTEHYEISDIGVIGGRMPFDLTRVYRSNDSRTGPFGIGTSYNFQLVIRENSPQLVEIVQPNNNRTQFPIIQGTTNQFANIDNASYRGAVLTKANGIYSLKMKGGEILTFGRPVTVNTTDYYLSQIKDRNGNSISISFFSSGNRVTSIASSSGSLVFIANNDGTISSISDQAGRFVTYSYVSGRLDTVTDQLGQKTKYTYDSANRLVSTINKRGITEATRTYDANGRIITEQMVDGSAYQFNYTLINPTAPAEGIASTTTTDLNGYTQTIRIDSGLYAAGNADGFGNQSVTDRQSASNRINSVTDRLGRITTPTFDNKENLLKIKAPDNSTTSFTYDSVYNLLASTTDALGKTSTIIRDSKGNPTKITDPLGHSITMVYDSFGQVTSMTNALNQTVSMAYDFKGNLLSMTDPLNHTVSYGYDTANRTINKKDQLGKFTSYGYDNLDRLISVTTPKGRVTKYAYDPNDNLLSVTDPAGNITTYTYDNRDRLTKRTDASGKFATYEYDPGSRLIRMTDRKGQITNYQYDANDRLIKTIYNDGSIVTKNYDKDDRVIAVNDTTQGAGQHTFSYDIMDRLLQEATPRGTVAYNYDILGRQTNLVVNGSRTLNYDYDNADRLTKIIEGSDTISFGYDDINRRTSMTLPNGVSANYNFDDAGRLAELKYTKGSTVLRDLLYGYDAKNRRTSYTGNTAPEPDDTPITATTVNSLNQYTNFNGQTLQHDLNGNLLKDAAVWDARDRLVSLTSNGITATFTYDALNRRTSKTINGQTETYLYDGDDIISESGAVNSVYTHGSGVDEPLIRKGSAQSEYYLADHLGSVIGLTDISGNLQTSYNYSAYGKKQTTGAASSNPIAFTGREDDGNGYYYYRARYYNPDLKRFASEDPAGFGGGDTNFYAYVSGGPTSRRDPSGRVPLGNPFDIGQLLQGLGSALGAAGTALATGSGEALGAVLGAVAVPLAGAAVILNSIAEPAGDPSSYYAAKTKGKKKSQQKDKENGDEDDVQNCDKAKGKIKGRKGNRKQEGLEEALDQQEGLLHTVDELNKRGLRENVAYPTKTNDRVQNNLNDLKKPGGLNGLGKD
jgi:RHS repeat-associated protein